MMASKEVSDLSIIQKEVSRDEASTPTSPTISIDDIKPVPEAPIPPPTDPEKADPKPTPPPYTAFSSSRQTLIILIATAAGFFSPLTGAVYLPSLILFEKVFNTNSSVINATLTVYFTVFAIAPLFGAAASDYGGRKTVYVVSLAIFLAANAILAAVPPNLAALFVLRVFQALGSSMVTAVGAGTVADITEPAKRASRMGIFLLGPQLGPLLGPLIGGQFANEQHWRWIFGFLSVACAPVYLMVLFFLPETLRCLVGNGSIYANKSWLVRPRLYQKQTVDDGKFPKPPRPTIIGLLKTLTFLPNAIVSFSSAFNYSGLYCIYVQFPKVWQTQYGWSGSETGYAYMAPGFVLLLSSLLIGRVADVQYRRYKAKHDGKAPPPENRLDLQVYGYVASAAGKVMFGWFVSKHYHPVAALVASSFAAVGTGVVMVSSTAYQTECQPSAAALLVALSGMLRNIGGAISAAIIAQLVEKMGAGWFMTGLGFLDVLCIGGLIFIRFRGHIYRERLSASVKAQAPPGPK